MKELINIEEVSAIQLFQENGLDPLLESITKEVKSFVPDVSTAKGRKDVASLAMKVAKSKTYLDNCGKDYVAKLKELPKVIDAERKRMRDYLDTLKDEVRKPLTDWEEAEENRKNSILARVNKMLVPDEMASLEDLEALLKNVTAVTTDESFEEYQGYAEKTRNDSMLKLEALIARKKLEEKYRLELEEKRKTEELAATLAREELLKKQAAEAAKLEAEEAARKEKEVMEAQLKAAQEAREKAERDKIAAEERAKLEQELALKRAEDERLAKEAQLKAEDEKRAANNRHRATVNNKILADLKKIGIADDIGKKIIAAIVKGEISNTEIKY